MKNFDKDLVSHFPRSGDAGLLHISSLSAKAVFHTVRLDGLMEGVDLVLQGSCFQDTPCKVQFDVLPANSENRELSEEELELCIGCAYPCGSYRNACLGLAHLAVAAAAVEEKLAGSEEPLSFLCALHGFHEFPYAVEPEGVSSLNNMYDVFDASFADNSLARKPDDFDFAEKLITFTQSHTGMMSIEEAIDKWQSRQQMANNTNRCLRGKARFRIGRISDRKYLSEESFSYILGTFEAIDSSVSMFNTSYWDRNDPYLGSQTTPGTMLLGRLTKLNKKGQMLMVQSFAARWRYLASTASDPRPLPTKECRQLIVYVRAYRLSL